MDKQILNMLQSKWTTSRLDFKTLTALKSCSVGEWTYVLDSETVKEQKCNYGKQKLHMLF